MNNEFYLQEKNGVVTLKCRAFDEIEGLRYGFSTRHGGVSLGDYASMSFSYQKESEAIVDENFRRFCGANDLPFESLVLTHQTHTNHVAAVDESYKNRGRDRTLRETDGVVTSAAGLGLICFTADCVPILMVEPEARVVAAVHAANTDTRSDFSAELSAVTNLR